MAVGPHNLAPQIQNVKVFSSVSPEKKIFGRMLVTRFGTSPYKLWGFVFLEGGHKDRSGWAKPPRDMYTIGNQTVDGSH